MNNYLSNLYYDPKQPGAFSGVNKFFEKVRRDGKWKISRQRLSQWLQNQDAYSLHRSAKKRFKRNKVITSGLLSQLDADLCDVSNISKFNSNTKFILVVIDCFSRYAWLEPIRDKTSSSVVNAFRLIFKKMCKRPFVVRTDKGFEFTNCQLQRLLSKMNIKHFVSQNDDIKANFAERFIQTFKKMMYRYFTRNNTLKYLDVMEDLLDNYNKRPHRSLNGLAPADIDESNEAELWLDLYRTENIDNIEKPYKFKINDLVRISLSKRTFQKNYEQKWSEEVFKIFKRNRKFEFPTYKLRDRLDEEIVGSFYSSELQRVEKDKDSLWSIDKILKTKYIKDKNAGKVKHYFVSWRGFPKKFNSWVSEFDMI